MAASLDQKLQDLQGLAGDRHALAVPRQPALADIEDERAEGIGRHRLSRPPFDLPFDLFLTSRGARDPPRPARCTAHGFRSATMPSGAWFVEQAAAAVTRGRPSRPARITTRPARIILHACTSMPF